MLCLLVGCSGSPGTPDAGRWPDARGRPDASVDASIDPPVDAPFIDALIADAQWPDGGPLPDANLDADIGTVGRICVVIDLRFWNVGCLSDGADGLRVTVSNGAGTVTVFTGADGSFVLFPPAPPATVRVTSVTGTVDIVTSVTSWNGGSIALAAPLRTYWNDLAMASNITVGAGRGSAIVAFRFNNAPAAGVLATSNPVAGDTVHYDGNNVNAWDTDSSGTRGIALVTDLPVQTVTVTGIQGTRAVDVPVAIEAGALTFATGILVPL